MIIKKFLQLTKMQNVDIILLNGQVKVIILSILIRQENILLKMLSWYVIQYIWIHLLISSNGILIMKIETNEKIVGLNNVILTKVMVQ